MNRWIFFGNQYFNLQDFCHLWIETDKNVHFYWMGEWRHNGEEVVISESFPKLDDCNSFMNYLIYGNIQ